MVRWSLAVLVLAGTAAVAGVSALTPHLRVCEQVVAQVGDEAVAQTCRPIGLADPTLILAAGAAVLLLLPDLRRVNIAGLFELERRVEEQQDQTEELRDQVSELRVVATQTASQQVVVQPMLISEHPSLPSDDELKRRMEAIIRERS